MQHDTSTTPRPEHPATRQDALQRARAGQAQAAQSQRAEIIREYLPSPRAKGCRCPITPLSTREELRGLGAGCTAGRWVCLALDAIRRRLGT
jgi:hypothetical protein